MTYANYINTRKREEKEDEKERGGWWEDNLSIYLSAQASKMEGKRGEKIIISR